MAGPDALEVIRRHLDGTAEAVGRTARECAGDVARAAELIATSIERGGKVLICGNGGSAADAEHMASELLGRLTREFERPAIPAIALPANSAFMTAYANDVGFKHVFSRQVQALGRPGDVLICISTSGLSPNVVRAAEDARRGKLHVVTLTGPGGVLPGLADVAIQVPGQNTQHIQEAHLAIEHIICGLVERRLYGSDAAQPEEAAGHTAPAKERPRGSR